MARAVAAVMGIGKPVETHWALALALFLLLLKLDRPGPSLFLPPVEVASLKGAMTVTAFESVSVDRSEIDRVEHVAATFLSRMTSRASFISSELTTVA